MVCKPTDISIPIPSGPSGPPIPGFGTPFALKLPNIAPFPDGFPEDLLALFDKLSLLIPPGIMKPHLSVNYGKDVFDSILSLLDHFFPFLMLYKFFLPILNIIICIIEVLCSLTNPFKMIRAIRRLFRNCIPEFLNLFPIFALIVMLISLLLLLLALIEYILSQLLKLIKVLLRNINALVKSFSDGDENSIKAIAKKIGSLLCIFQNLFILFAIFNTIIEVIRDILRLAFSIPPCDDTDPTNVDGCCTPDVCPAIVKQDYTRTTGTFQYLNEVDIKTSIILPPPFGSFNFNARQESWQLYDVDQQIAQEFINIVDGYDVPFTPKPVFFPTDVNYNAQTTPKQAAYTVDLRLFYNPVFWGRSDIPRHIRFKDCIITHAPSRDLSLFDNSVKTINSGVAILAGGTGFEDDGVTPLFINSSRATLENFIHLNSRVETNPIFFATDGYTFGQVEYTFRPHIDTLLTKDIVTLGCEPSIALNKTFINTVFAGDAALKGQLLGNLVNGSSFPDISGAQQCLLAALAGLRNNVSVDGVAQFQAITTLCLQKLKDDTNAALEELIKLGVDPCKSTFTADPHIQFTSRPIKVSVNLNDRNGLSLTSGLPQSIGDDLAALIKGHITFGEITPFAYDGYQIFNADLTSNKTGSGKLMISFDNNTFCTNTIPADTSINPTHDLQVIDYSFIQTTIAPNPALAEGDQSDGAHPRFDEGDLARETDTGVKGS